MEQKNNKWHTFLICVVLLLGTLGVYWQVHEFEFVNFDDCDYVRDNQPVSDGLTGKGFVWAFTTMHMYNWHPLTWLSHMLDCELFGLNPCWHHITNLIFHIMNTLLLFWILKKMTFAIWPSAFVAAAFALHPLHVESVTWISERKDVLSTFFWFLTMWSYVCYTQDRRVSKYALVLVFFIGGLLSKPMLVTLPFVLLLLDYWPLRRLKLDNLDSIRETAVPLVAEKIPLFIIAAISCVITYIAQKHGGSVGTLETFPFKLRFLNAIVSYSNYIGKMIWPTRLSMFYIYRVSTLSQIIQALAGLIIVSYIVGRFRMRFPYLLMGWFWYIGTMIPVIGLIQVGMQSMADRYTYVPLTGLFIMIAWGAVDYVKSKKYNSIVLLVLSGVVLSALAFCTWRQVGYWRSSVTLYEHALDVNPNNYFAHIGFGRILNKKGELDDAIIHYKKALRQMPKDTQIRVQLAGMLFKKGKNLTAQGNLAEAIQYFNQTLLLSPDDIRAYYGIVYVFKQMGDFDEVIKHCENALSIKPNDEQLQEWLEEAKEKKNQTEKQNSGSQ